MKKVKLDDGFTVSVEEDVMDDMELLDDLVKVDEGDGYAISRIVERILGGEEKKKLYEHLRNEKGKIPITVVVAAIRELFEKLGDKGKN